MKRIGNAIALAVVAVTIIGAAGIANAGEHRLGGGLHYLRNLADIENDSDFDLGNEWDNNSFSIIGSYQYNAGLLKFEGDVEYVFDYAGTGEAMWIPSAWLLAGGFIYGGAGIGSGYIDGEWQDDPFYALRAGVDIQLSKFDLDIFGTYQFQDGGELEDLTGEDLDSVTFAALLRFSLGGGQ
jgi:hypothetical protein